MRLSGGHIEEETNRIKTGDTVLISGLHGKKFKFINNKYGKIQSTYIRRLDSGDVQLANVMLLENGQIFVVNFDFIYKVNFPGQIVDNIVQHLVTISNPIIYYLNKKSIVSAHSFHDELGQCMTICTDKNGRFHVMFFSTIN